MSAGSDEKATEMFHVPDFQHGSHTHLALKLSTK